MMHQWLDYCELVKEKDREVLIEGNIIKLLDLY